MPHGTHTHHDTMPELRPGVRPAPRHVLLAIGAMLGGLVLIVASALGTLLAA